MDEATANVDFHTDALIHRTVREHFRHCTVLVIAHRLGTVMSADRVIVLERGQLVEVGAPRELLGKSHGAFRALAKEA
jgi:ATP-binding cassette subfamily C (CFTR/MRP) protein 1